MKVLKKIISYTLTNKKAIQRSLNHSHAEQFTQMLNNKCTVVPQENRQ